MKPNVKLQVIGIVSLAAVLALPIFIVMVQPILRAGAMPDLFKLLVAALAYVVLTFGLTVCIATTILAIAKGKGDPR